MSEARDAKIRAAVYTLCGALWLSLSGACTWNVAANGGSYGGLWVIGLWFMSIGLLPLVVGLQTFLPAKVLGWVLCMAGGAWLAFGAEWLAKALLSPGGMQGESLVLLMTLWVIFEAPGGAMLLGGVSTLRRAAAVAPSID